MKLKPKGSKTDETFNLHLFRNHKSCHFKHRIKKHPPGDVIYNIHKNYLLWDPMFPHPVDPRLGLVQPKVLFCAPATYLLQ